MLPGLCPGEQAVLSDCDLAVTYQSLSFSGYLVGKCSTIKLKSQPSESHPPVPGA